MKRLLVLMVIGISLVLLGGTVLAEESAPGQETLHIRPGKIHYSKDQIELTDGVELYKGNGETTVNAERGLFFSDENRAQLTGNIQVTYEDGEVSSEKLQAWLDRDEYLFEENVLLKSQTGQDKKMELMAPYLKLFLDDNSFAAKEGVEIEYDQRTLQGEIANYSDQEQTLELIGKVYIEEENGDWVKGDKALFDLETEEFTVEGGVELEVKINKGDSGEEQ